MNLFVKKSSTNTKDVHCIITDKMLKVVIRAFAMCLIVMM